MLLHVDEPEAPSTDWDAWQRALAPLLDGMAVQPVLRRGPVAREILAVAREEGADLILLTRHGRWQSASDLGFPRFLLQSVLCRVLLDADCPVWVEPEIGAPPAITHVLCAVASLVHDRTTIDRAGAMAGMLNAGLVLFRNSVSAAIAVPGQQERSQAWQQEVAAATHADLDALREKMGVAASVRVGIGDLVSALLQDVQTAPTGLVAVRRTSRDWGKDETLLPLIRHTNVPVLVYPGVRPRASGTAPGRRFSTQSRVLVLVSVMLLGVWLVHHVFSRAREIDCETQAYRCAVRENLMNSTKDRMGQPQPKADPKLGPFKDDPPPKGAPRPVP